MNDFLLFEACVGICALMAFYRWLFVPLRIDDFRYDIRSIRDDLFDFMWHSGFDFAEPAYVETHQTLNGLLRSAPHLSLISFLWHAFHFRDYTFIAEPARKTLAAGPLRDKLDSAIRLAITRMLCLIFLEGIVGVPLRLALRVLHAAWLVRRLQIWAKKSAEALLSEAYILGRPQLTEMERLILGQS